MTELLVSLCAQAEIEEAIRWYEEATPGMGSAFHESLYDALTFVSENPEASPVAFDQFRCKVVKKFPFLVFYLLHAETIEVIAVAHQKRRPGYWRDLLDHK